MIWTIVDQIKKKAMVLTDVGHNVDKCVELIDVASGKNLQDFPVTLGKLKKSKRKNIYIPIFLNE